MDEFIALLRAINYKRISYSDCLAIGGTCYAYLLDSSKKTPFSESDINFGMLPNFDQ